MPGFAEPSNQWLGQQLGALKGDVAALKAQGTEYIVDNEGVCRAIIGHLVAGPKGEATGLEGWGVAVLSGSGIWEKLGTGVWEAVKSASSKLSSVSVEACREGTIGRLSGNFTAKEAITTGTILFVLPITPSVGRFIPVYNESTGGIARAAISTAGHVEYYGAEAGAASVLSVEGDTFRLA